MTSTEILTCLKKDIPHELKPQLAELMRDWEIRNHKLPAASSSYYKLQLDVPPELEFEDYWALALEDDELKGYGKIEWKISGSNKNRTSLLIHFLPNSDTLDNHKVMIAVLLDALPSYTDIVDYWLPEGNLMDKYFISQGIAPSYKERISVSVIQDHFDLDEIQNKSEARIQRLSEKKYELLEIYDADFSSIDFAQFVRIYESIVNDMPLENLTSETRKLSPERIRDFYDTNRKAGVRFITFVARASNGDIAGFTQTTLNEFNSKVSEQGDTGVVKAHRGNGIGLTLKYQTLLYLLRHTEVEYWMTGNAGSNGHMIRINELLWYEPWFVAHEYEFQRSSLIDLFG